MKEIFVYALLVWAGNSGQPATPITAGLFFGDDRVTVKKDCDDAIIEYQTSYRMGHDLGYGWLNMACVRKGSAQ